MSSFRYENIRGLDVAVNNAFRMGSVEGVGDLDTQLEKSFHIHRATRNLMFQCQTIKKFHDEKPLAVMVGDLVDRTNVRMIQSGCCSGFPPEAFQRLWVFRDIVREKLDGHESTEHGVLGFVDDSHAATT